MKTSSLFHLSLLLLLLVTFSGSVQADLAKPTRHQVDVRIQLMNGAAFPGYTFFIRYDAEYDPSGYWKKWTDTTAVVVLESEKEAAPGYAWGLFARDTAGREYKSLREFDPSETERYKPDFEYYLDQIVIERVGFGMVTYKVVDRKKMGGSGDRQTIQKGEVGSPGEFDWAMAVMPIVCFLGLVAFLIVRKRKTSQLHV
jgi:hypothetical protein